MGLFRDLFPILGSGSSSHGSVNFLKSIKMQIDGVGDDPKKPTGGYGSELDEETKDQKESGE